MEIKVTKTAKLGEKPVFNLFIDGLEYEFDVSASRKITNTTDEFGSGIFSSDYNPWFERGGSRVCMGVDTQKDIPNCTPYDNAHTAEEVLQRIVSAKNLIDEAFDSKYPATNEVASVIL